MARLDISDLMFSPIAYALIFNAIRYWRRRKIRGEMVAVFSAAGLCHIIYYWLRDLLRHLAGCGMLLSSMRCIIRAAQHAKCRYLYIYSYRALNADDELFSFC